MVILFRHLCSQRVHGDDALIVDPRHGPPRIVERTISHGRPPHLTAKTR
jgi:hypothetical protein